jgi:hypothetical protein
MAMPAPSLTRGILSLCLLSAVWNAFFYLNDLNYPPAPGTPVWISVASISLVYALFALLGWSQRRSKAETIFVLLTCILSAGFLLLGRGRDWYGSMTIPNYYNQVIRLGTAFGGLGQIGCLLSATVGVGILKFGRYVLARRRPAT